jgi:predicted DNA-binding protein (UPF0251 family)
LTRNKRERLVNRAPDFEGFKPFGTQRKTSKEVLLCFEEYEAIRLCDYDNLKQEEAALQMNVSRPTFTRIYASARQKIAQAMVEASVIRFDSGDALLNLKWYNCSNCNVSFSATIDTETCCPLCGSTDIKQNL